MYPSNGNAMAKAELVNNVLIVNAKVISNKNIGNFAQMFIIKYFIMLIVSILCVL